MSNYIRQTYSIDETTQLLLEKIAAHEADGETPNESRTIRRLIREKAQELGIVVPNEKKTRREKAAAI